MGVKDLNLDTDSLPPERVLGVEWCVESDTFQFRITLRDRPMTRRGILSTVSSIYDPLGFAAPFLFRGKRILQLLCKEGIGWDDPVPEPLRSQWESWRQELPLLERLVIPRCLKTDEMKELKKIELHHFSDASTEGYGQCSYIRLVDDADRVTCALVMGKARVTPLKPITVPRLELAAALLSVKISLVLRKELRYELTDEIFWTDSQVVLAYINNEARRFHTYVANRVQQIREGSSPDQWEYIESNDNPADDASRGLSPSEIAKTSRWLKGPSFLWNSHEMWKNKDVKMNLELSPNDKEIKRSVVLTATTKSETASLLERLSYFSDWHRAKKAVALCLRYVNILHSRVIDRRPLQKSTYHTISVDEMNKAELVIIKAAQKEAFAEDMKTLAAQRSKTDAIGKEPKKKVVKKESPLSRLAPFIDQENVLRVGGRISQASISEKVKHPVLLPKGHIASLVAKDVHEKTHHQGRGITLNELRSSGFWIVGGSGVVSRLIYHCVICRRLRAAVQGQKMADLPPDRLEPAPPFSYCGVDYFGPWIIKERRKELKRYGVLFTCFVTRAIHLEVANTMTTNSYINALRRFICRRGPVRQMRSDNGSNFLGACRELKEALAEIDKEKVKSEMLKENCDWFEVKLNPPYASHMGGTWERQIRTVRSVLSALLHKNGQQLDDEALRTFMCEAEAVVNSRPLTTSGITSPAESPEMLTPNHFLTMKSKVILPPPGNFTDGDLYSRKQWRRVQHLSNEFWCRWKKEFLHSMQERQKWHRPEKNLKKGDIVMVKDNDAPRNSWKVCRVDDAIQGSDGLVRRVRLTVGTRDLSTAGQRKQPLSTIERPIHKLVLIQPAQ